MEGEKESRENWSEVARAILQDCKTQKKIK
jgi:hypothetical protein